MNLIGFAEMMRDEIKEDEQEITSLSQMEGEIREGLKQLGAVWLGEWLGIIAKHYTGLGV